MREALRRSLWLLPTVFIVSVVAFWGLSFIAPRAPPLESWATAAPAAPPGTAPRPLPLFFNANPTTGLDRVEQIASEIANGINVPENTSQLIRLGAAALPVLMPYLEALSPAGRAEVAHAMSPIAQRMGVAQQDELASADLALLFWTRYWADHSIDFRQSVVERAVARLVTRPSAGHRRELVRLDTFALAELIEALPKSSVQAQYELSRLLFHITGHDWLVAADASPTEAQRQVRRWQNYWVRSRSTFVRYEGAGRAVAMFEDTQYGRWVLELTKSRFGLIDKESAQLDALRDSVLITLALILAGLLGGYTAGPLLGSLAASLHAPRRRAAVVLLCATLTALPSAVQASVLRHLGYTQLWLAHSLMFVLGASIVCLYEYQITRDATGSEYVLTQRAFGASRLRASLVAMRTTSSVALAHLTTQGARLFAGACIIEVVFGLQGVGERTVAAMKDRDVTWLMLVVVVGTLGTGLLQIVGDQLDKHLRRTSEHRLWL